MCVFFACYQSFLFLRLCVCVCWSNNTVWRNWSRFCCCGDGKCAEKRRNGKSVVLAARWLVYRDERFSASHMMISKYKGARSCSFVRIVLLRLFFVAVQHGCEPERPRERCFSPAPAFFTVPSFFLVSLSSFLFAVIFFSHSPAARGGEWKRV